MIIHKLTRKKTTINNYYSKEPENTQEEPEETSVDQPEKSSASVDLHGEKNVSS
ncbi:hypothetical protein [Methanosarcina barkeri]|uniref:hypothetical protein n=1 Tax=Methanosarcina barkeri TaxID=2208 RepID=UPI000B294653|nr:hypothetical protein [Methanosarcina barkeri]